MHLFQELKQQSILKQATLEKMSAPQFKITKVGVNNFKARYDTFIKQSSSKIWDEVYMQILESMLGPNWSDQKIAKKKLEDLKKGHYNDQVITILPGVYKPKMDLEPPYPPLKTMTRTVKQISNILFSLYSDKFKMSIPQNFQVQKQAIKQVQESGIIFLDQIDKLAVPQGTIYTGKGVSTEGVQRDLLPLLQGTVINTKYGDIKTDHILFIASGSFSMSKVEDLIPQLLGRLPLRVQLNPITLQQFERILKQPQYNLLMQQTALMGMDNIDLKFMDESIKQMARMAFEMNQNTENLGARRLYSIVEKVVEEVSYDCPKHRGKQFIITKDYVTEKLKGMQNKISLDKFLI